MNILLAAALSAVITAGSGGPADTSSTYVNPILNADYSDPDAIRVEGDYWMTASSFNHVPGLQILHSADLVHWTIVNAALPGMTPEEDFSLPSHGNGVWAPSIRCHDGIYRIFWATRPRHLLHHGGGPCRRMVPAASGHRGPRDDRPLSPLGR